MIHNSAAEDLFKISHSQPQAVQTRNSGKPTIFCGALPLNGGQSVIVHNLGVCKIRLGRVIWKKL